MSIRLYSVESWTEVEPPRASDLAHCLTTVTVTGVACNASSRRQHKCSPQDNDWQWSWRDEGCQGWREGEGGADQRWGGWGMRRWKHGEESKQLWAESVDEHDRILAGTMEDLRILAQQLCKVSLQEMAPSYSWVACSYSMSWRATVMHIHTAALCMPFRTNTKVRCHGQSF